MKILALDGATELCSAALWLDGTCLTREDSRPRASGERLLGMIAELLAEAAVSLRALDMIAFGRGPGGFTGVRLATAVAQGLGFAAGLPLLPISDLRAVAQRALNEPSAPPLALVCQDARMRQVYWGCFGCEDSVPVGVRVAAQAGAESVSDPEAVALPSAWGRRAVCGAGSGFEAYSSLAVRPDLHLSPVWTGFRPRATEIVALAAAAGLSGAVAPEAAQPVYLRDEVAAPPSRN